MTGYVALIRAVNVGGTGKLPMTTLLEMCQSAGFGQSKTYLASGNAVFTSQKSEAQVRSALEEQLQTHVGKPVGVLVRTAAEMASVLARNPFEGEAGNRVITLFVDGPLPADPLDGANGLKNERVHRGKREIYVLYPDGMGATKLRLPSEKQGTARNLNTVTKLAEMAAALEPEGEDAT
ncbi:DUF1697 domain-containing protein [Luteibacter sahnii]|uniref:DUF1697 domain-containing protein n=1 Tax=Luteibacter sahnii TaxID=3021977 RepID=UPI002A69A874|nr:DUF1697 domain-containing protein [Luteibacter sp. PPL193]MDY1549566.1 DUF1697 domain-containing protein [Luteibacter sp. PPL193]